METTSIYHYKMRFSLPFSHIHAFTIDSSVCQVNLTLNIKAQHLRKHGQIN